MAGRMKCFGFRFISVFSAKSERKNELMKTERLDETLTDLALRLMKMKMKINTRASARSIKVSSKRSYLVRSFLVSFFVRLR